MPALSLAEKIALLRIQPWEYRDSLARLHPRRWRQIGDVGESLSLFFFGPDALRQGVFFLLSLGESTGKSPSVFIACTRSSLSPCAVPAIMLLGDLPITYVRKKWRGIERERERAGTEDRRVLEG